MDRERERERDRLITVLLTDRLLAEVEVLIIIRALSNACAISVVTSPLGVLEL